MPSVSAEVPGKVQEVLLEFISRLGRGNELKIAGLFKDVSVDLGLALVRLLSTIDTPEAKEAIAHGSTSPLE